MDPIALAVLQSWTLDFRALTLFVVLVCIYTRGWKQLHTQMPHRYQLWRLICFITGLVAILLAIVSPVDAFGSLLLQVHMLQHLLLLMVAPPLIWLGQPALALLRGLPLALAKEGLGPFLCWPAARRVGRAITHPLVCWFALAITVVGWHVPALYELGLHSHIWHELEHGCFLVAALLFWWPVIEVWPSVSRWPRWTMIPYLLLADLVNTALSAVLSFSTHVLYRTYEVVPRLWGISAIDDQATAGAIMWVPGSIAFLVPAVFLSIKALEFGARHKSLSVPVPKPQFRPKRTLDVLRVPILGRVLRSIYFRRAAQATMLALAAAVVVDGLMGTPVSTLNLAGVLPWTYWRGLAVISLLAVGNCFCMVCPFTLPRELARRVLPARYRWPRGLRSKWIAIGLLLVYLWAYEAFSLWDSPWWTAWLVIGYFVTAFVVDGLFQGATFCKYVCPIGQFHFVQSLVSPFEVKVRDASFCRSCVTRDCLNGNEYQRGCELDLFQPRKHGNFDCTFCLDCVRACPQDNIGVIAVTPTATLVQRQWSTRPDISALMLLIVFGGFVNAAGMTDGVMTWMHQWHGLLGLTSMLPITTAFYGVALLVIPAAVVLGCAWIGRVCGNVQSSISDLICRFTPALVPLGFSMWLAHFSGHLLTAWRSVIPVITQLRFGSFDPDYARGLGLGLLPRLEIALLDCGLLVTLYVAWRVAQRQTRIAGRPLGLLAPWAMVAIALFAGGIWIFFQPMQMRGTMIH